MALFEQCEWGWPSFPQLRWRWPVLAAMLMRAPLHQLIVAFGVFFVRAKERRLPALFDRPKIERLNLGGWICAQWAAVF